MKRNAKIKARFLKEIERTKKAHPGKKVIISTMFPPGEFAATDAGYEQVMLAAEEYMSPRFEKDAHEEIGAEVENELGIMVSIANPFYEGFVVYEEEITKLEGFDTYFQKIIVKNGPKKYSAKKRMFADRKLKLEEKIGGLYASKKEAIKATRWM